MRILIWMLLIFPTVLLGEELKLIGYAKPAYLNQAIRVDFTIQGNEEGELILPEDLGDIKLLSAPTVSVSNDEAKVLRRTTTYTCLFTYPKAGVYLLESVIWKSKLHNRIVKSEPLLLRVLPEYEPVQVLDKEEKDKKYLDKSNVFYEFFLANWNEGMHLICEYPKTVKVGIPFRFRYVLCFQKFNFKINPIKSPNIPLKYILSLSNLPSQRKVTRKNNSFMITLWECELSYPEVGEQKIPSFSVVCNQTESPWCRDTIYCQPCTIQVK